MYRTARRCNRLTASRRVLRAMLQCGLLLTALAMTACNDTNNAMAPVVTTPTAPPVVPPMTPTPAKAARVEIVQTGLLFTERGQTRQLAARVFDASGAPTTAAVRWASSDASNISVSNDGLASAERASGSTQITAMVDELRSPPLLAVVTTVAPGTLLVSDAQIVRGVVEAAPDAAPSLDNSYTVVVSGIAVPAVDTLMVGTGSEPVAGRVVAAREVAGGVEVTLKLAPLPTLFPGLEINQRLDLAQVPATIPESVSASYDVAREGNRYRFTPRPESASAAKAGGVPTGTRELFQGCEGTVNGVGLGEGAAPPFVFEPQPVFDFTIAPALDVIYTEAGGLERFVVTAEPTFLIDGTIKATAAFEGKIGCKAELLIFPVPVGGALSVLISGLVPVGVGFELAGKVTVAQLKLGMRSRTSAKAALGLDCQGDCTFVNELSDFTNTNTPTVDVPGADDFRVKPELSAFGYVEAAVGNRTFQSLQFKAFEIKAGPKLEGEFAPAATQIAATDFKAGYKLSLVLNAGFGDDIEKVLNILGVVKVGDEVLEQAIELGVSPTGVLMVDRDRFNANEAALFELKLDPATATFLGLNNVSRIVLMRQNADGLREVAGVTAQSGQTTFNFTFIAPDAGLSSEFTAFALSPLLPEELVLELDTARSTNAVPVASDDFASVLADSPAITVPVLNNDSDADADLLRVQRVSPAVQGQVSITADGMGLSYRPAAGFTGTDTFAYGVTDDKGGSDEGVVTVEVRPAPVASARISSTSISTSASARACRKNGNGICEPKESDQRRRDESGGSFSPAGSLSSSQSESLGSVRSDGASSGGYTFTAQDGELSQIELDCTGMASASAPTPGVLSEAGGSTQSGVAFRIEGSATLRYEITVLSSEASAGLDNSRTIGQVFTSLRSSGPERFFNDSNSQLGNTRRGSATGTLGAGQYFFNQTCIAQVNATEEDGGGPANSTGRVRLTLTP